jgi:DHA2 family multidrug resistance protein
VGIATVTTILVRGSQAHQNYLASNLTAGNSATRMLLQGLAAKFRMGGSDAVTAQVEALGALYRSVQQQAAVLSYADNFRLLGYLSLLCIPLVLLFQRLRHGAKKDPDVIGE